MGSNVTVMQLILLIPFGVRKLSVLYMYLSFLWRQLSPGVGTPLLRYLDFSVSFFAHAHTYTCTHTYTHTHTHTHTQHTHTHTTHTHAHTHSRPPPNQCSACRTSRYLHNTQQTSLSAAKFEPAFPAIERPQTYALDLMVTGTGSSMLCFPFIRGVKETFAVIAARKLSVNLYDIHHCCVYSEKLLMMGRGTVRNMQSFIPKNKFEKLVHLVGFIIRRVKPFAVTTVQYKCPIKLYMFRTVPLSIIRRFHCTHSKPV